MKDVPNQTINSAEEVEPDSEPAVEKNTYKQEILDDIFHCKECLHQCNKEVTFIKHINTTHPKQNRKVCI